jgi:cyanate permease
MALGFSASMAVHPPLAQWLSAQVGWRAAWLWLGILTWTLLIPPILLLVQNKPEDLGLKPDGASRQSHGSSGAATQDAEVGLTVQQALGTPAFWITAFALATMSMLVTALFFHQVSLFTNHGVDAYVAARMFSVSALTMVVAMPLVGRLRDRFPTKPIFACATLTQSAALIAIVFVDGLASALVYGVVFGLNNAAVQTHYTYVWPRFFGRRYLGSIQGTAQTIGVIGASIGPLPFGAAFDLFGSYAGALLLFAVLPVLCAAAIMSMPLPRLEARPPAGSVDVTR